MCHFVVSCKRRIFDQIKIEGSVFDVNKSQVCMLINKILIQTPAGDKKHFLVRHN